jgi:hypothetical protein
MSAPCHWYTSGRLLGDDVVLDSGVDEDVLPLDALRLDGVVASTGPQSFSRSWSHLRADWVLLHELDQRDLKPKPGCTKPGAACA